MDPDSTKGKLVFNRTVTLRDMWTKVKGGTTAAECEQAIAADPYRVRVLLAYWLEEGIVAVEHLS